jgi:hypothetical protein
MLSTSFAPRPQLRARQIAILLGAGALAISATLTGRAIMDFQSYASDHVVEFSTSYKSIPDMATLTRQADLVIVGNVVNNGATHFATPSSAAPASNPAPAAATADGKKADALKSPDAAAQLPALSGKVVNTIPGTPFTTFDIQVERVLRGQVAAGSQIQVTQPGGHVTLSTIPNVAAADLHRTVEFEHDTLMQAGDKHVMFLQRAGDGSYFVLGGPQGRFSLDRGGKVHPIDPATPASRGRDGQLLETLAGEVRAAN